MGPEEQRAIEIAEQYVGHFTLEEKIKKMGEEVIELALAIGKGDAENIAEELGDCGYILLHMAHKIDPTMSFMDYITASAKKMEQRKGMKDRSGSNLDLNKIGNSIKIMLAQETTESVDDFFEHNIRNAYIYSLDNENSFAAILLSGGIISDDIADIMAKYESIPVGTEYSAWAKKNNREVCRIRMIVPDGLSESETTYYVAIPANATKEK